MNIHDETILRKYLDRPALFEKLAVVADRIELDCAVCRRSGCEGDCQICTQAQRDFGALFRAMHAALSEHRQREDCRALEPSRSRRMRYVGIRIG